MIFGMACCHPLSQQSLVVYSRSYDPPHASAASQSLLIMSFKNNLSPGEWREDGERRGGGGPVKMLEAASKAALKNAI